MRCLDRLTKSFLLIVFLSGSAWAQSAGNNSKGEFLSWHYKLGLDERFRYEYKNNFDFDKTLKDEGSLLFNRVRVNVLASLTDEYSNKVLDVFVEGADCQVGSYRLKQTAQKDNFDLLQSYVNMDQIFGSPIGFKMGRQEMNYGKGRLIAASSWANLIRTFDAAVLKYRQNSFYADLFYAQVVKNLAVAFDRSSDEEELGGIYAGWHKNDNTPLWEGYFLTQIISSGQTVTERYTVGPRCQLHLPQQMMLEVETPYQFGRTGGKEIRAYAIHADLSKVFDRLLGRPKVTLSYDQASGNQKPSSSKVNNTFIPLYQTTHDPYGIMDFFRWQNIHDLGLNIIFYPTEKLRLIPQLDFFWLDSKYDSWYNSSGTALRTDTTGVASSYVGSEFSLRVCYDVAKNIKTEMGYAHFFVGDYVRQTGSENDADWLYTQITFKY